VQKPHDDGFVRHELGLLVPRSAVVPAADALPAALRYAGTYLSYEDITGRKMRPEELMTRLRRLSVEDCLGAIARLSVGLSAASVPVEPEAQARLIRRLAGDGPLGRALEEALHRPEPTVVICEQQLIHLARLAILHADRRPHDDFGGGKLYDEYVTCLLGVTDLLDLGLAVEDRDQRLAWELRQCGLNHHDDTMLLIAIHHAIYRRLWRELRPESADEVEAAFKSATGMSISDYFVVGSAASARFMSNAVNNEDGYPLLRPASYFSAVQLQESDWKPFFGVTARGVDALRAALRREEREYGGTTYGSLTFERWPLCEVEDGTYLPISMAAFDRRITQGVFHILAEAAEEKGCDRRKYTSHFGAPFQELVERTLRRGVKAGVSPIPLHADVPYGTRSAGRRSSDVILGYERNPVLVDAVSGPLQVATTTRGDLGTFEADTKRLVISKAEQLGKRISELLNGEVDLAGIDPSTTSRVWPVVVTSHPFPHRETIIEQVQRWLTESADLADERIGELAVVSAEELAFCEGHMEHGHSFLALIRGWKTGSGARLPFKNYLIQLGGGQAPAGHHYERLWAEAMAITEERIFGKTRTPEEILAALDGHE